MRHRGVWLAWLVVSALGVTLLALPDRGPRLFSLSRLHGPSFLDAVGAALLATGWLVLDVEVLRRRRLLRVGVGSSVISALFASALLGLIVLTVSILGDHGAWWLLGAALLAAPQVYAALVVTAGRDASKEDTTAG